MSYRRQIRVKVQRITSIATVVMLSCFGMLTFSIATPLHALADSDTYSWSNATYVDANYDWGYSTCPSNDSDCMAFYGYNSGIKYGEADPWVYYLRNCTSYVAEKIDQEFNGRNISGWGNAASWATSAQNAKYTLDSSPQAGDIAVWGTEVGGGYGHVAYVYAVSNGVGSLDEYNVAGTGQFTSNRTTASGSAGPADWYIHMGTPADGSGGTSDIDQNPAAVSWAAGRIDVFGQGTDGGVYHNYIDNYSAWQGWTTPYAGTMTSGPAVASWGVGRLDAFARGLSGELEHTYFDGSWHSWENLGDPSGLTIMPGTTPTAVSWGSGRIDVFVQATDGQLYQDYYTSTGWSGWAQPFPGVVSSGPAVSSWGAGRLDVFARGTASDLVHAYYDNGTWYQSLQSLGDPTGQTIQPNTDPTAVSWGSGRIDVFVQGTDGQLHQIYYDSSVGSWSSWATPIPGAVGSGPAVSSWGVGRLDVFARGTGGDMVHAYYDNGTWYSSLGSLGGSFM